MSKVKLYPVCNWERNQHKMYNYNDKMYIKAHEENTEEAWRAFEESERLLEVFNGQVRNGLVYAVYEDYCLIKDILGYYDWTHG